MLLEAASLKSFAHSLIYEYLGKTGVKLIFVVTLSGHC